MMLARTAWSERAVIASSVACRGSRRVVGPDRIGASDDLGDRREHVAVAFRCAFS